MTTTLWVESHRLLAYGLGLLVRHGVTPCSEVPVFHLGRRVLLDDNGGVAPVEADSQGFEVAMSRTAASPPMAAIEPRTLLDRAKDELTESLRERGEATTIAIVLRFVDQLQDLTDRVPFRVRCHSFRGATCQPSGSGR